MKAFPAPVVINRSRKVNMYRTSVYECFHQSLRYFQHAHFISIVGVGKRDEY